MKRIRNQSGMIDIILILVVFVLAAGLGGYVYYQQQQAKKADTAAGTGVIVASHPKPKTVAVVVAPDPYSGWTTYTSSYQQASFKYPSTWKISTESDANDTSGQAKDSTLTSANGLKLYYNDIVGGIGGGCESNSPHINLTKIQPIPNTGATGTIYLVENNGNVDLTEASSPPKNDTGTCLFYALINSKVRTSGYTQLSFGTGGQLAPDTQNFTSTQKQDVPTAELILKSFHY